MKPKSKSPKAPPDPFRWFDSSPEVIRLVVMMYVRYQLSLRTSRIYKIYKERRSAALAEGRAVME